VVPPEAPLPPPPHAPSMPTNTPTMAIVNTDLHRRSAKRALVTNPPGDTNLDQAIFLAIGAECVAAQTTVRKKQVACICWQPRCRRKSCRPVALRLRLSTDLPFSVRPLCKSKNATPTVAIHRLRRERLGCYYVSV
jgi:hypothetical protein